MKLYGYWRSTAAYRVRIALNLLELSYESISVHLVKDGGEQHHQDYMTLNPSQLVPTLVDGEVTLSQSMAIIEYLDQRYGESKLLPNDCVLRAHVRAMAQDIACDIHPLNNLRVVKHLGEVALFNDQDKAQWMAHWMISGFNGIEQRLGQHQHDFCFGDSPSMADICLVAQVYNARRFNVPLEAFERIRQIEKNCLALDAFKCAQPEQQQDVN